MTATTISTQLPRLYAWFAAVQAGDHDLLSDLLAYGMPVDTIHPLRHSTALMEATRLGRANTVHWLLEHGAAPAFLCGLPQGTALHCAIRRKHWKIAEILVGALPSAGVIDAYGATPLHLLAHEPSNGDHTDTFRCIVAEALLEKHCPLDALDHDGTTVLHHCAMNDHQALAMLLLKRGANPNARIPDSGVSALIIAALERNVSMAQLLIAYGADTTLTTHDGATAHALFPELSELFAQHKPGTVQA